MFDLHSFWKKSRSKDRDGLNLYYMEENPEELKKRKTRTRYTGLVYLSWLLTGIIFLVVLFTYRSPDIRFNNERVGRLTGTFRISWEDPSSEGDPVRSETGNLPYQRKIPAGQRVAYSIILPEERTSTGLFYNSIMFRALHEYVRVYLDGDLLYEFGYDQSVAFCDAPNNGWLVVRLPDDFAGRVLTIEKTGYYDNYAGLLQNVYLGTKNALVFYVLNNCLPLLFINLCIILLSLFLLTASFFFKRKHTVYQLRYLGVFSIITSVWLILESGGYQLFAGKPVIISNLVYLFFSLIPLVFIRFLLTFECFQETRYMSRLFYCSFASFLLTHILQLTGLVDYLNSIFLTHVMIVLAILGIAGRYIRMWAKKEEHKSQYLFLSCIVFALFAFIDLIRFYLKNPSRPTLYTQIGFFLYFVILCCFAIHKIVKDNEESMNRLFFQQMAYTDILTGLPNRNAFEREMEYYRKESGLKPAVMVIDLNGLKKINDTFGHTSGDNAIVETAHSLRECFADRGHVFRIGGDEFCAIFQDGLCDAIRDEINCFRMRLKEKEPKPGLPLSVAIGLASVDEATDIDGAFRIADACMYEDKKNVKKETEESGRVSGI